MLLLGSAAAQRPESPVGTSNQATFHSKEEAHGTGDAAFAKGKQFFNRDSAESYKAAIAHLLLAARAYQFSGDFAKQAAALTIAGASYQNLNQAQEALKLLELALPLARTVEDPTTASTILDNIGTIYEELGDKRKALSCYSQALAFDRAAKNPAREAVNLHNIGLIYVATGDTKKALDYFRQELPLVHEMEQRGLEATALHNIGKLYADLGDKQKALEFFNQALPLERSTGDRAGEAVTLNSIGGAYAALGETQTALGYYSQALPIRKEVRDRAGEALTLVLIGQAYADLQEQQKALDYYTQALSMTRVGRYRTTEATTLNNIGAAYSAMGEKQKALDYYTQSLLVTREVGDRTGEALTLNNIGLAHSGLGKKQQALDYYNQALPIMREVGDRIGEAVTLNYIGLVYVDLGESQSALDPYSQALLITHEIGDGEGEAKTLNNIGQLYSGLGQKQKALDLLNQALLLGRTVRDDKTEAITLNNIGLVYADMGENDKALGYYNQALRIRKKARDRTGETRTLDNIAAVFSALGEKQKALDLFKQSLPIWRALGDQTRESETLNNIATVYSDLGENQRAIDYLEQARQLEHASYNERNEARTLNNIANVYADLGENEKALDYYTQALPLAQIVRDRANEAVILNNIGAVYEELSENRKALEYYNKALAIKGEVGDHAGLGATFHNIAVLHAKLGEIQKALDSVDQALLFERAAGDRMGEANTLSFVGLLCADAGLKQKALDFFNQALPLELAVQNREGQATTLGNLAWVLRSDNPRLAIVFAKKSVNLLQALRHDISGLRKEIQHSFIKSKEDHYRDLADLLVSAGRQAEAQQALELLKEEEYFEFARVDAHKDAALAGAVSLTLRDAESLAAAEHEQSQLAAKVGLTAAEKQRKQELDIQLKMAQQAAREFFDQDGRAKAISVLTAEKIVITEQELTERMQKELARKPGSVKLYTLLAKNQYHTLLMTPTVMKTRTVPISREDLRKKLSAFVQMLRSPENDPLPLAQELYGIIVGNLRKELGNSRATTLLWSLDDRLRYIPMAALHDGQQYLVERYRNVVYTKANRPLAQVSDQRDWRALAGGVSEAREGLPALQGVRDELQTIVYTAEGAHSTGIFPGLVMLNADFTAPALRAALQRKYALVHFASHFILDRGSASGSYLLLGKGKLTLAEFRDSDDFTFDGVELLTLSACDTAVAAGSNGREIDGLGMLAERKGARTVVATLWKVNDVSTADFMRVFYRRLRGNGMLSPVEALQRAQLALLQGEKIDVIQSVDRLPIVSTEREPSTAAAPQYVHPYYWAPFILMGNEN